MKLACERKAVSVQHKSAHGFVNYIYEFAPDVGVRYPMREDQYIASEPGNSQLVDGNVEYTSRWQERVTGRLYLEKNYHPTSRSNGA